MDNIDDMGNDISNSYDLSVIIITRNEEEVIEDCITSVLNALEYAIKKNIIKTSEVILVDSASKDNTIIKAKKYPIKIIQLESSWPLSAGAGMYIGVLHSNGRFFAKVDGDTIVFEDWFANALPSLQEKGIGGVTGIYKEEVNENNLTGSMYAEASLNQPPGIVEVIATGIFNRMIVLEAGSFNPFLKAAEDKDLSWKINALGYKLIRLPFFEIRHFIAGDNKKLTFQDYLKKMFIYSIGEGHAARYSINNKKIFMKYVLRYATVHFAQIYILLFLWANLIYSNYLSINGQINSQFIFISDFIIILFILFIIIVRYKGGKIKEFIFSFHAIPYIFVRHLGFILGLMKSPKKSSEYPTEIKIVE